MAKSKGSSRAAPRMSKEQLNSFIQKNGEGAVHEQGGKNMRDVLASLSVPEAKLKVGTGRKKMVVKDQGLAALLGSDINKDQAPDNKKKRRGVEVQPIMQSLLNAKIFATYDSTPGKEILNLWFDGARVLTVNELFAILQYRKHETYRYKKVWKEMVEQAIQTLPLRPQFNGHVKLTLFRSGKKLIDKDSFQTIFKYPIDGLRKSKVIVDDNPNIVVDTISLQHKSPNLAIGIRVEAVYDWVAEDNSNIFTQWFNEN